MTRIELLEENPLGRRHTPTVYDIPCVDRDVVKDALISTLCCRPLASAVGSDRPTMLPTRPNQMDR